MIEIRNVRKVYEGSERPAVRDLSFDVPTGQVVALIGPSGCGKSTTMRMVNRLVEPDSGTISIDGEDVRSLRPETLRRHIGYAIQGVGLFPHWTVAQNVGVVPGLLQWDRMRIAERTHELLDLVGLDPAIYADKHPDELSGGEAQRVGVARALAADPPILLMDEPFGAVDPLTRDRLHAEFRRIQDALRKTVLFVTHDMDEAVRLGDRIVVMRDGSLVQQDTPERVLAYPVDGFVASFVGAERALKRLSLAPVTEALYAPDTGSPEEPAVASTASLREALAVILEAGVPSIPVHDEDGAIVGAVSVESIVERFRRPLT
ncbi:ABC transporter ATP-binding protein [Anaerosoma tenue]|uniref:ABC transporter ATP-binding protein n=1 Tax=Anaerosoma tenue TaxID=2933588 RepID=UPI002260FA73|nr:ABC transporter ATP-binding protein [Anaerosoma tenue]MCK8114509.1 ABC transporter ATP-binding protein [Anaerosoma tenue]